MNKINDRELDNRVKIIDKDEVLKMDGTLSEIARHFGVTRQAIWYIKNPKKKHPPITSNPRTPEEGKEAMRKYHARLKVILSARKKKNMDSVLKVLKGKTIITKLVLKDKTTLFNVEMLENEKTERNIILLDGTKLPYDEVLKITF